MGSKCLRLQGKVTLIWGGGGGAVLEPELLMEESWVSEEWAQCTSPLAVLGPGWGQPGEAKSQWESSGEQ